MKTIKIFSISFLLLTSFYMGGCASPARVDSMQISGTPSQRVQETDLRENVAVYDVTGGQETNPMWTSEVSSSSFKAALENSLKQVGLYAPYQLGKYRLVAHLENLDQPLGGFNMTVTARVNYILYESSTGTKIYNKVIEMPYTEKMSSAFLGTERLRLANEGAIRVNIESLMNDLFALNIENIALK